MSEQQLHLFPPRRPLLERFGAEFFRSIPHRPGVYIMVGETGTVLYIGQSKNLRARLGSYKNAIPDRAPRKVIRLIHLVKSIVWEECPSTKDAMLKENQLLRTHRPKFNRMNTYPKAYGFIIVARHKSGFSLRLSHDAAGEGMIFGAFKGGWIAAHGALIRLLWASENRPQSPADFPTRLLQTKPPRCYHLSFSENLSKDSSENWEVLVTDYLAGRSNTLISTLTKIFSEPEPHLFLRNLISTDLEILIQFYLRGPARNRRFTQSGNFPTPLIPQEHLDDFLVTMKDIA